MVERWVEVAPDGSTFGDRVVIEYEGQDGERITFYCDPDGLYDEVRSAIAKLSQASNDDAASDMAPEMAILKKQLTRMMRASVKAVLLAYGDKILTFTFRTKDHPRPQKGDDLLEWYTNMFARIAISFLMKKDTVLTGKTVEANGNETLISIEQVTTRPIPTPAPTSAGA